MGSRLLRVLASAAILAALATWLDARAILALLLALDPVWAALALAISVPQVALLAFRWRLTAGRLGLDLPFATAWREYYLAIFLNQVLPGGVGGDVSRAWRHARSDPPTSAEQPRAREASRFLPAASAVVLERGSAQVVMGVITVLSLASLPVTFGAAPATVALALLGAAVAVGLAIWLSRWRRSSEARLAWVWRDAHAALLARDVVWTQLVTSTLAVGSYVATYLAAARAVGVATPLTTLLPLVAPVLVSMLIPASVAGWGLREATAAGLWSAVGLTAVEGVAISAAYGLVALVASLPGAAVLVSGSPDRTGGRRPDGSAGSEDAGPPPASRSAAG